MSLKIGYYDPFNIYPLVQPSLESKLPLTNVHWKPTETATFKSIPKLPIELVEELPKKIDQNVTVRLMFIQSHSLDMYKSQVRPLIKEWLKHSINPEIQWLIVLYTPIKKDKYTFKTSMYEKLKVDFGVTGKELSSVNVTVDSTERCFKLKETNDNEINKLEVYNDLINKFKELILKSFTASLESLDEQINGCKTKDLIFIELMLKKSKKLEDHYLFKEGLRMINISSKLIKNYYGRNKESYKFEVPKVEGLDWTRFFGDFEVNILEESNSFNLLTHVFALNFRSLVKLIEHEKLSSIKAIHISALFQEFLIYLSDLMQHSESLPFCYNAVEWILGYNVVNDLKPDTEIDLSHFYEFRGDLKLFQRSVLGKLGAEKDYKIHEFEEISLADDSKAEQHKHVTLPSNIESLLSDESTFYSTFEKSTESAIEDFLLCNRSKTIDVLSIDLAILRYRQKDFKESLNILQNSYEFLMQNGWNYMGGLLLKVYIECIESLHLKDTTLLVKSYVRLFSSMITNNIDINRPRKDRKQISDIFNKIVTSAQTKLEFPVSSLTNFELNPFISLNGSSYCMKLKLFNLYGIELRFESISLEVSGGLNFAAKHVCLPEDAEHMVELTSTKIVVGYYRPVRLIININSKLRLVHEFSAVTDTRNSILDESVIEQQMEPTSAEVNTIYYFPDQRHFDLDVVTDINYLLGSPSILLKARNGTFDIENLKLIIINNQNFKFPKSVLASTPKALGKNQSYEKRIPVTLTSETKTISLTLQATFSMDGQKHEFVLNKSVDLGLIISVSVQDIFKVNYTFSNFKISPAIPSPIRILSTKLDNQQDKDDYHIITPCAKGTNDIVSTGQVYSSFYKIAVNNNYKIKFSDEFQLTVEYSSIFEECQTLMKTKILEAFEEYDLNHLFHFYLGVISPKLKFDYQAFGSSSKVVVINITEVSDVLIQNLRFVDPKYQTGLKNAIINTISTAHVASSGPSCINKLEIIVPVPKIDILQTIEFNFSKKEKYLVGEPIIVNVQVESCTRWKSRPVAVEQDQTQEDLSIIAESSLLEEESLETFYINLLNDENWLCSGFKKKQLTLDVSKNLETRDFDLILIPLTVGKLTLPKFSVKFVNNDLTVDVSTKNGSENLLVVPELERLTFSF